MKERPQNLLKGLESEELRMAAIENAKSEEEIIDLLKGPMRVVENPVKDYTIGVPERVVECRDYWVSLRAGEGLTEAEMIAIVKKLPRAFNWFYFRDITKKVIQAAVEEDPHVIKDFAYQELDDKAKQRMMILEALKRDGTVIQHTGIDNGDEEFQITAVKQNRSAIKYMWNPCAEAKRIVKESTA